MNSVTEYFHLFTHHEPIVAAHKGQIIPVVIAFDPDVITELCGLALSIENQGDWRAEDNEIDEGRIRVNLIAGRAGAVLRLGFTAMVNGAECERRSGQWFPESARQGEDLQPMNTWLLGDASPNLKRRLDQQVYEAAGGITALLSGIGGPEGMKVLAENAMAIAQTADHPVLRALAAELARKLANHDTPHERAERGEGWN